MSCEREVENRESRLSRLSGVVWFGRLDCGSKTEIEQGRIGHCVGFDPARQRSHTAKHLPTIHVGSTGYLASLIDDDRPEPNLHLAEKVTPRRIQCRKNHLSTAKRGSGPEIAWCFPRRLARMLPGPLPKSPSLASLSTPGSGTSARQYHTSVPVLADILCA
eukprot:577722-Rhodomonas_salina.2